LSTTLTELNAIAPAASMGPPSSASSPAAAIGMPITL
jgi:hypothetical protein